MKYVKVESIVVRQVQTGLVPCQGFAVSSPVVDTNDQCSGQDKCTVERGEGGWQVEYWGLV
jgi:hypothetical protein